jgi:hypothetical protein
MKTSEMYRSAYLLIQSHGMDASICAAVRSHELLEAGDPVGQAFWMRLVGFIEELLWDEPAASESVH